MFINSINPRKMKGFVVFCLHMYSLLAIGAPMVLNAARCQSFCGQAGAPELFAACPPDVPEKRPATAAMLAR